MKTFWIGKDLGSRGNDGRYWYCVAVKEMYLGGNNVFHGVLDTFCASHFEGATGIVLKPGEQRQYTLTEVPVVQSKKKGGVKCKKKVAKKKVVKKKVAKKKVKKRKTT